MGSSKESGGSQQTQQTTYQPTAEETELNKLQLEQARASQAGTMQAQQSGLSLINQLLTGQALPGYLNTLPGGISPDVTQGIVNQSLRDVAQQGNMFGIGDSGTIQSIGARTAGDIRLSAEEFNLQNLMQLLNLASGQAAQTQSIGSNTVNSLGSRLAGLRPMTQTGTTSSWSQSTPSGLNMALSGMQGLGGLMSGVGGFWTGMGWGGKE